jgi:hypothetical protein
MLAFVPALFVYFLLLSFFQTFFAKKHFFFFLFVLEVIKCPLT